MLTTRFNPMLVPFNDLRREVNRLFETVPAWTEPFGLRGTRTFPTLNAWEDADHLYIEAEVPGLSLEDLDIQVLGNELSLKGERKAVEKEEGTTYHRRERFRGSFLRSVTLPTEIDADNVKATLRNGVLSLTLPKQAATKARKIEVKVD